MTNENIYDKAAQAAESTAIPTAELLGEVFAIESFKSVETQFGKRYIATIRWPADSDETQEAWMSGVILSRQLDSIKDDLPAIWTLHRDDEPNSPYKLIAPPEKPKMKPKVVKTFKERIDDPLDYFRLGDGTLDSKAFVQWWNEQELDSNDLASVIGKLTMDALEAWFAADATRTVQGLVDEAAQRFLRSRSDTRPTV
jgi:hypothetical protein